jgi:hypothetical protein
VDSVQFEHLVSILDSGIQAFSMHIAANEAKRIHLIAPILWTAVLGLNGFTIDVKKRIVGPRLKALGEFEFMINHKNAVLGIFEAKKDNFSWGLVQSVLGMEVAVDLDKDKK